MGPIPDNETWSVPEFVQAPMETDLLGEDNFRHLAEALPQIVWTSDPDGVVDYINPQWGDFTGLDEGDPDYLHWAKRIHAEDLVNVEVGWAEALKSGDVYEAEFRIASVNGTYFWFTARAIPVRNAEGGIIKWYGVTTDIDQQKRDQFQLAQDARRKDEFIAMLGHELRNPLAAIALSCEILASEKDRSPEGERAFGLM